MEYAGETAAMGAAVCWTLCSLAFAQAGKTVGALSVNLIRLLIGGLLYLLYGWLTRGMPLPLDADARMWGILSASGVVGFFLGDLFLFKAFLLIGPRLSLLVLSLAPPIAALLALGVLGESLAPLAWLGMAVTLGGVAWVVLERPAPGGPPREKHYATGLIYAALGAAGQAGGYVLSRLGMGTKYDPFAAAQIRLIAGTAAFVLLFTLLRRWGRFADAIRRPRPMAYLTFGAFTGPFLGVSLSLLAVQYTKVGVASTILATSPILIVPFAIFLYRERVSPRAILGAAATVAGVALLTVAS